MATVKPPESRAGSLFPSLALSPSHRGYRRDASKPSEERKRGNVFLETWDVLSSEASREATSVSDDGVNWSPLDQPSVGFNSCSDFWWSLCLHMWTVLILIKTYSYQCRSSCFLSAPSYLFDKHLHMNKNLCTVSCSEAHEPFLLAEYVYTIYSLFIDILIVNPLFNNPE